MVQMDTLFLGDKLACTHLGYMGKRRGVEPNDDEDDEERVRLVWNRNIGWSVAKKKSVGLEKTREGNDETLSAQQGFVNEKEKKDCALQLPGGGGAHSQSGADEEDTYFSARSSSGLMSLGATSTAPDFEAAAD